MPTYQYECASCKHSFERFQGITERPVKKCPKCGKMRCHRLIGAGSGLIFRGSGFYITDHRSKEYKDQAKKESGASPSSSSSPSSGEPKKSGSDSSSKD
jgi:putative FmdB family regulatory protein